MSEKSVYQWRRAWALGGREALRSQGAPGYNCRLGPDLQAKLAVWLEEGPAAHGWSDDQVWTAARVRTLIGRKFHLSYSVSGVTRLLHRMGFSVQMPARPAAERDEEAITAWREVTWQFGKPIQREGKRLDGCRQRRLGGGSSITSEALSQIPHRPKEGTRKVARREGVKSPCQDRKGPPAKWRLVDQLAGRGVVL
ncbi:winged helix-turn-helix domain-containing protein [Streptomyces sp. ALI-76-A]|nr:winged helix-turn-helix domain-containing protein [Streptomyces sp. ALI-76-A]MDL5199605.1 winged helix-turn-helix domain-containing protein [Streptomyces sp. ALI-76-A]